MRMKTTSSLLALAACAHAAAPAPSNTVATPTGPDDAVVLVIDRSGSMQGAKLDDAKAGIEAVRAALPGSAELGLIVFDTQAAVLLDRVQASDVAAVRAGIDALQTGGGT